MPVRPGMPVQEAPKGMDNKAPQLNPIDLTDLGSKQGPVRIAAFNNLADSLPSDLSYQHGQKIARYLLLTAGQGAELEAVLGKLEPLAKCRFLLQALADVIASENVTQQRTEAIVGGILRQPLRFAKDEDWRSACRKPLLQRALEMTGRHYHAADRAADFLRDLYKEQGLAFGLESPDFLAQTQLNPVLEGLIKHVAARAAREDLPAAEKDYLEQIDRHLRAARFVAANDLEHVVLLQRTWLKVLIAVLQKQVPAQAKDLLAVQQELDAQDRLSRSVLEQLRSGEEKVLRVWTLAHNLK